MCSSPTRAGNYARWGGFEAWVPHLVRPNIRVIGKSHSNRAPRQGRGFAGLAGAVALVAACAAAGPSIAQEDARAGGCGIPYLVHSTDTYDQDQLRQARHNHYHVHHATLRLVPPVNWARDPYSSRRFRGALASLTWLDVLFFDYRTNDRVGSLRKARDLALDWIRSNPPGDGATDRTWDDRVSATRAPYLAYAKRASECEGLLNERKRDRFDKSILVHGERAQSAKHYRPTNHGLFVDTNLILLARQAPGLSAGRGWEATGKRRFLRTLRGRTIGSEGFWLEHSTGYQIAVWREVRFFQELVGSAKAMVDRMADVAGWMVEPDERLLLLGSTNYKPPPPQVRNEAQNDDGILWLPRSGLAVVKSAGGYVSAAATFFNRSHKHSDELSFDLYDEDRRIVSDSGEYEKDPGRWKSFQTSPRAHSTLTVDGQRFGRNENDAYGSGLIARGRGDDWFAIQARNPLLRDQGVDHQRLLLYRPGLGLLVVDRVSSGRRHTYRRFFQFGVGIDATRVGDDVALSEGGWSGRLIDATAGGAKGLTLAKGEVRPSILGFEFPDFRERRARWVATLRTRGEDLDHLAVLATDPVQQLDARLLGSSSKRTRIELETTGVPSGTLEVVRRDDQLDVSVEP